MGMFVRGSSVANIPYGSGGSVGPARATETRLSEQPGWSLDGLENVFALWDRAKRFIYPKLLTASYSLSSATLAAHASCLCENSERRCWVKW